MTTQTSYAGARRRNFYQGNTLGIIGIIFGIVFVGVFAWSFLTTCIFHWPFNSNVGTCWNEQIKSAQAEAITEAAHFMPGGAFYTR